MSRQEDDKTSYIDTVFEDTRYEYRSYCGRASPRDLGDGDA